MAFGNIIIWMHPARARRGRAAEEKGVSGMLDCGKCGGEDLQLEEGVYTCRNCGKTYTEAEARQREAAWVSLNKKRKLLIGLMAVCMVFLVVSAILLPGYYNGTGNAGLMYAATAACAGFFIAALVVRILFGKERKKLYPGK